MTRPWTVFNPSGLQAVDDGLWCITDDIPDIKGTNRRMTIVRRRDGSLLFYNAIPVRDEQLEQLKSLGKPSVLVLPNQYHMLDGHAFAQRLGLTSYGPAASLAAIEQRVPNTRPLTELAHDEQLTVKTIDGFSTGEGVLVIRHTPTSASLVTADVVTNAPATKGLSGLLMRMVGFTGPLPTLPGPVRMRVGKDMKRVGQALMELANIEGLNRLIPSHGDITQVDVPGALRRIAARY